MLRIVLICFLCVANAVAVYAQAHAIVDTTTHEFGTVMQGENPTHTFYIKNTGSSPLVINKVEPACGCIAASFTREPILPGKTGTVQLIFLSETRKGFQMRSTVVTTNADNPEIILYMKGTIVRKRG